MILSKEEMKERTEREDKEMSGVVMKDGGEEGEGEGIPRRPPFRRWETIFR